MWWSAGPAWGRKIISQPIRRQCTVQPEDDDKDKLAGVKLPNRGPEFTPLKTPRGKHLDMLTPKHLQKLKLDAQIITPSVKQKKQVSTSDSVSGAAPPLGPCSLSCLITHIQGGQQGELPCQQNPMSHFCEREDKQQLTRLRTLCHIWWNQCTFIQMGPDIYHPGWRAGKLSSHVVT